MERTSIRIRDTCFDTGLGRHYLLVTYGIRVVAILLIGRRPESDWTRIQRDANFPDVIPVKLKGRVIRWKDRWYAREANRFYIFLIYETKYISTNEITLPTCVKIISRERETER